jgi:hypothetical protein
MVVNSLYSINSISSILEHSCLLRCTKWYEKLLSLLDGNFDARICGDVPSL